MTKTIEERAEELLLAVETIYGDSGVTTRAEASAALLEALREQAREDAMIAETERERCDANARLIPLLVGRQMWAAQGWTAKQISIAILAQLQQGGEYAAQKGGGRGE